MRGGAKLNLEDYKGSIDDFTMATEINPNEELDFYNRSI